MIFVAVTDVVHIVNNIQMTKYAWKNNANKTLNATKPFYDMKNRYA